LLARSPSRTIRTFSLSLDHLKVRLLLTGYIGPKHVVLMIGRNKIVRDLDEAMLRIKNYAAPVNALRWEYKTPCTTNSYCELCKSPDRICSTWTITEKSFPKGRVKVILINAEFGF